MYKLSDLSFCLRVILRSSLPVMLLSHSAWATEYIFDTEILKKRGVDASVNTYFANEAKFLPGMHPVSLKVNGKDKGTIAVRFGQKGELCVDNEFLSAAGLQAIKEPDAKSCHDYHEEFSTATITPLPNGEQLVIVVPPEAVANDPDGALSNVLHGGSAGVLNYNLFSTSSRYDSSSSDYRQAMLEGGMNIADWFLRSNYVITSNNGDFTANSLYTYAAHTFVEQKRQLQIGQVNAISGLFSGTPINGVQWSPESALFSGDSGVTVRGIARGAQARVEVRQTSQLVYSTLVPAGPFTLDNVPIIRSNTDLDITVVETDGSSNHYVIAYSSLNVQRFTRPQGFSLSVGQVRDVSSDYSNPMVANYSNAWRLHHDISLTASGVQAKDYQAAGALLEYQPTTNWDIGTRLLASRESFGDSSKGTKGEISLGIYPLETVSFSASAAKYSADYRELTDALNKNYTSYANSYSTSVTWNQGILGTLALGYSLNQGSKDNKDSCYLNATWSKSYERISMQVNWQSLVGNSSKDQNNEDIFYVNISIPLGSESFSTHMRKQGDDTTVGATTSGSLTQNTVYSVSTDRDIQNNNTSFNGDINTNLHYTQLDVGAGAGSNHQTNYNMTLSGGVVMHENGVTFSPYSVKDTFAIARLSEAVGGIEISTPQGIIWTDAWGQAVVPGMPLYRNARIEINSNSLPQSMDLANGTKVVAVGHGSVSRLGFKVLNSRRVMLRVLLANGEPLQKGVSVVDEKSNYIVTAVDDGHVFLNDVGGVSELYAADDDGKRLCQIHWKLPEKQDKEAFYEQSEGVCR
ncbi:MULTISPECIES: fimbrial biogenesis usher protein [Buttiauxella]|uniref:fimbrial biogenesis usher protein n=1 Tax=Buttiauxella TaxID=82976 RepID=UPI001064A2F0|nr:fimbrial biogenesis usher protein [Buttiauxella sp. BIGb0552]TDX14787.1 outer membrane usher protein FimD/PapC [Buttiauxella sp. BIGb0552]